MSSSRARLIRELADVEEALDSGSLTAYTSEELTYQNRRKVSVTVLTTLPSGVNYGAVKAILEAVRPFQAQILRAAADALVQRRAEIVAELKEQPSRMPSPSALAAK